MYYKRLYYSNTGKESLMKPKVRRGIVVVVLSAVVAGCFHGLGMMTYAMGWMLLAAVVAVWTASIHVNESDEGR